MQFSHDDVRQFAEWSRDRNPLHVDPVHARDTHFGRPLVHGMLTVVESLFASSGITEVHPITALDIEFRGAVVIGGVYQVDTRQEGEGLLVTLRGDDGVVLTARTSAGAVAHEDDVDLSWVGSVAGRQAPTLDRVPVARTIEEIQRGVVAAGVYDVIPPPPSQPTWSALPRLQARVLALCSYVVGMEVPGLKSLFTRATVRFHAAPPDTRELRYRAKTVRFDRHFRLLDIDLEVATADGDLVATARLRSYVPFSPVVTDIAELVSRLGPDTERFRGKVALVCGASRGLGADFAATLAAAGCHVYAASRGEAAPVSGVAQRGGRIEPVRGDVGDAEWCRGMLETIRAAHGRLDVLVLNACAPPGILRIGPDSPARQDLYVRENLRLVQTPLSIFLSPLAATGGCLAYVSSSFVDQPVSGLSHYVALKLAAEGLVRTAAQENPQIYTLIARPPALQTRWNDTPTGAAGAISADWVASHVVNRAGSSWAPGRVENVTEFPAFERSDSAVEDPPAKAAEFSIRVAASFTAEPLVPGLRFWMKELEIESDILLAPYGQVLQSLLDPSSVLSARGKGLNVVLLRVRDWLHELSDEKLGDLDSLRTYLADTARDFERAVRAHRASGAPETLLLFCPSYDGVAPHPTAQSPRGGDPGPHPTAHNPRGGDPGSAENVLLRQTESALMTALEALPGLQVASASAFHELYRVADEEIADPLRDHIAHIPYHDAYLHTLTAIIARHVHRKTAGVRKVVVVDCDNTLWGGVVGEVGAEGVEFDAGHRALHRTLVRLTEAGLLVCLCSKNEEPDVWRVFETRPELGVPRESVVAAMINWQRKSQNLRTLASRLNVGLDSFIFIDDNPVECAEVRAGCPDVLTIQWPREPERALRLLQHFWEFDRSGTTKEDQRRTQMYREEFRRQALRADTLTFDDFIKNLQLAVDISPLSAEDVKRASQLTLRTNQFNFTTIRRDEAALQALAFDGRHDVRTIRVRDRFGDYGLVGLVIADRDAEAWALDTFLLSCRVLGRGVEHRILADLGERAAAAGAGSVRLRVDFTKRNTPARTFLESAVPEQFRHADERAVACDVPPDALRSIRFEPSASVGEAVADEAESPDSSSGVADTGRLRRREAQIARTAFDLSDSASLRAAIEGSAAPAVPSAPSSQTDIAAVVHEAFAAALRLPVDTVKTVDELEALGCDSMRVVEITVALSEIFPWLPSTLLFEFRSVSQIVAEIVSNASRAGAGTVRDSRTQVVSLPQASENRARPVDVAVVGLHLRCAGASSPDDLWTLLSEGTSAVRPVPPDRELFLQPLVDSRPHWAGLMDDVARFDAELFGVSPRESEVMDPQLRLFLEVAWGALEDAGYTGAGHQVDTGVFVGVMYGDYGYRANDRDTGDSPYRCWEGFSLANRLSQLLGFQGPSLAVDTACSSSATALHLACNALRAGECRAAVVGGVNLILDPDRFGSLGRLGILSPDGKCEPFGADANGTVLGEGAGVVVLRPLDDALARGDRIYGVIKGTALSTGNGTVGFTAPNPQAQADAIRRSLQVAQIDPRTISYVETHGTGTALGDPIEVRGLTLAFADPALLEASLHVDQHCTIGSIKPNIGHLEAGAGVLGLIKVLLQLQRGMLLPSITSREPSPHIPFADTPFSVQRSLGAWARPTTVVNGVAGHAPRRAGLNSFGVGGANAHVIIEEPPVAPAPVASEAERPVHLLAVSARSKEALSRYASSLAALVEGDAGRPLADVCFTLNTGRKTFEYRAAIVAADRMEMAHALRALGAGREAPDLLSGGGRAPAAAKIAFLFTGQGAQYAGMGRELYASHPVFAAAIDRCAATLDTLLDRRLLDLLFADEGSPEAALLDQTGYTQPALFAFEYALAALWQSWGVTPDVVMGHSVGEIAAMCVAGAMSLDDGLTLIAARGRLMQALPTGGGMTSVMASEELVSRAITGREGTVTIAAINGPSQIVISGVGSAVAEIAARLGTDGVRSKALNVSHAFHSPLMSPMRADYERVLAGIRFLPPKIPVVSCVTGMLAGQDVTGADYWIRQVLDPVRFAAGMRTLEAEGVTTCVEIGPHPVLLGMGRQCVSDDGEIQWLPSLRRDVDPWRTVLGSVGRLYVEGAAVDWNAFDAPYGRHRVAVPAYAFGGRSYWLRQIATPRVAVTRDTSKPDAAGGRKAAGPELYEVAWRDLRAQTNPATGVVKRCVIFVDQGGVGRELATVLGRRGLTCIRVARGDRFAALGDGQFEVNPASAADLVSLYTAIGPPADDLCSVQLWGLDLPSEGVAADILDRQVPAAIQHAVDLVRTLASAARPTPVWFVTQGATAAGDRTTHPIALTQAPLWGFARTVSLEHPDLGGGIVDLSPAADPLELESLANVLLSDGREDQVALRGAARYAPRLVLATLPGDATTVLDQDGTYLVTGGTGALGLHVAEWLVSKGARHLVLTSRRGTVDARGAAIVRILEERGSRVRVIAADVARPQDVDRILATIEAGPAPLRGVVHAAGVDAIVPIKDMTAKDVEEVLASKVLGAWLLHDRTRAAKLDVFVCFSSMASVIGAHGRAHYGAANAFLDALAAERRRLGLPITNVNWGPWAGGGMATDAQGQQFERMGNRGLAPADALRMLDRLVGTGTVSAMVADIDWGRFRPVYESRGARPLLRDLDDDAVAGVETHGTARSDRGPQDVSLEGTAVRSDWAERLQGVAPAQRSAVITRLLRQTAAETLGFDDGESVPLDRSFYEIGMDSLMMADLVGRLKRLTGVSSSGLVFDHPSVEALAPRLLEMLPAVDVSAPPLADAPALPQREASRDGLGGYVLEDEDEVIAFQEHAFPDRRGPQLASRWRWAFVDSARRLGVQPRVWVFRDKGAIVAQTGSIPVTVKIGGGHRTMGWLVDTMVLPAHRDRALGTRLLVQAHEDQPSSLSLGQTEEAREICRRLGWVQIAPLQTAVLIVNPEHVLQGKLPAAAAWAAGAGLRATAAVRQLFKTRSDVRAREVDRFDGRHDSLWECTGGDLICATVRDASYLNWKYVDRPGQSFLRLDLLAGDRLLGVAVWMFREPDGVYKYRRGFLVDVVAPSAVLRDVVHAASVAVREKADALLCLHIGTALSSALHACGYHAREPGRFLLADPGALTEAERQLLLDERSWFVTQGDSDIDRP